LLASVSIAILQDVTFVASIANEKAEGPKVFVPIDRPPFARLDDGRFYKIGGQITRAMDFVQPTYNHEQGKPKQSGSNREVAEMAGNPKESKVMETTRNSRKSRT
jgi:hypothetical protein